MTPRVWVNISTNNSVEVEAGRAPLQYAASLIVAQFAELVYVVSKSLL